MLGIFLILLFVIFLIFFEPKIEARLKKPAPENKNFDAQMKKLWDIAKVSMKERKTLRAEKALLTILKFDETNAAAYNRLGILYAKSQNYDEAIECFEIAQSLDSNPSSLHNVGLIYLETGAYEKASMAFQQALKLEGDVPARFIALAKSEEKLGHRKAAVEALESAYALDHSISTLRHILSIYEDMGDAENIQIVTARIEQQVAEDELKKKQELAKKQRRTVAKKPVRAARPAKIFYPKAKKPTAKSSGSISQTSTERTVQDAKLSATAVSRPAAARTSTRRRKMIQ